MLNEGKASANFANKKKEDEKKKSDKYKTCGRNHSGTCRHKDATCSYCNKKGHLQTVCHKKKEDEKKKKEHKEETGVKVTCLVNKEASDPQIVNSISTTFIDLLADSEASAHIVCNRDLLTCFVADPTTVNTASNDAIPSPDRGQLAIKMAGEGDKINEMILRNVLWAPRLGYNLISISALGKSGVEIIHRISGNQPSCYIITKY